MYVVHVDMKVKSGAQDALHKTFRETFRPAIAQQQGFREVNLLRPFGGGDDYRLSIVFETRELQQKWVAKDLHQDVWPQMESHCSGRVITYYDTVA